MTPMAGTGIYAVLALTAKLGAAMAFNVTFMFTAQLYPTSIRFYHNKDNDQHKDRGTHTSSFM